LSGQDVGSEGPDIQEVINYRKAMDFLEEIRAKGEGVTEDL